MKTCKTCGETKSISEFRKGIDGKGYTWVSKECKKCVLEKVKQYRKDNPEIRKKMFQNWLSNNQLKSSAHNELHKAQLSGKVKKSDSCEICKKENVMIFGHHEDYSKPLDVIYVCGKCHSLIHKHGLEINASN